MSDQYPFSMDIIKFFSAVMASIELFLQIELSNPPTAIVKFWPLQFFSFATFGYKPWYLLLGSISGCLTIELFVRIKHAP